MAKLETNLPKCRALAGTTCIIGIALAGLLQKWIENWPVKKMDGGGKIRNKIICLLFGHKISGDFPKLPVRLQGEKEYVVHSRW